MCEMDGWKKQNSETKMIGMNAPWSCGLGARPLRDKGTKSAALRFLVKTPLAASVAAAGRKTNWIRSRIARATAAVGGTQLLH